ncbi:hypothetical protein ACHAXS_000507 [Conticribra weissflogii]
MQGTNTRHSCSYNCKAEFVAMKMKVYTFICLRYKLRMMGVAIDGATYIYGDNMSIIKNTSLPKSTLNKKSNAVCYHAVRQSPWGKPLQCTYREQKTLQTL